MALDLGILINNPIVQTGVGLALGAVGGFALRPLIKEAIRNLFIKLRKNLVDELKKKPKYKSLLLEAIFLAQKELAGEQGKDRMNKAYSYVRSALPNGFIEDVVIEAMQDIYDEILKPIQVE